MFCHQALTKRSNYGALTVLENAMKELFPSNRDKVVILDIGAGTGISGKHVSIHTLIERVPGCYSPEHFSQSGPICMIINILS